MNNIFKFLATATIIISLLLWIPNIVFQEASSLWLLTFVFSGVGVILSIKIDSKILIIGNTITFFSFFILMFAGYVIEFLTSI
ncbi:hypothetical protein [Bacillus sp. FJAT-42315]|uniref:hypothetical protein n=1 Tax=Bacillus sp. FJAT-42315 TaxID=2014077 RepID=UPI000C246E79|nr:hypothetical protein [Bacillus sp. FJAT-42315]